MKLIAFDPGATTGIATFEADFPLSSSTEHKLNQTQFGPQEHHNHLFEFLWNFDPDIVIVERFTFRQRDRVNLAAPEYIGIIKWWATRYEKEFVQQMPSQAKGFWNDRKLKELHLYDSKQKHATDATRHLLYYITMAMGDHWFIGG